MDDEIFKSLNGELTAENIEAVINERFFYARYTGEIGLKGHSGWEPERLTVTFGHPCFSEEYTVAIKPALFKKFFDVGGYGQIAIKPDVEDIIRKEVGRKAELRKLMSERKRIDAKIKEIDH